MICRSYSDLNFGVTFLEHSVVVVVVVVVVVIIAVVVVVVVVVVCCCCCSIGCSSSKSVLQ